MLCFVGVQWHLLLRDLPAGYSACVSWVMNHTKGKGVSEVKHWRHQIVDSVAGCLREISFSFDSLHLENRQQKLLEGEEHSQRGGAHQQRFSTPCSV